MPNNTASDSLPRPGFGFKMPGFALASDDRASIIRTVLDCVFCPWRRRRSNGSRRRAGRHPPHRQLPRPTCHTVLCVSDCVCVCALAYTLWMHWHGCVCKMCRRVTGFVLLPFYNDRALINCSISAISVGVPQFKFFSGRRGPPLISQSGL